MNARNNRLIAISMLMGLVTLGVLPSLSLAFDNNQFQEAQIVDPFVHTQLARTMSVPQ